MKRYSLAALAAAGVLAGGLATSASAADLGGNCCADLEERIAELEATTARKGNRKVSLTISGFVAQQVMYWDDGIEDNVYITDTGSVSIGTHVRFAGQATIAPGWTAGYVLKLEAIQNDSLLVDQDNDNGIAGNAMAVVANGSSLNNGLGAKIRPSRSKARTGSSRAITTASCRSASSRRRPTTRPSSWTARARWSSPTTLCTTSTPSSSAEDGVLLDPTTGRRTAPRRQLRSARRRRRRWRRLRRLSEQQRALRHADIRRVFGLGLVGRG